MKFQLFLNHLSASQTIKTRNALSAFDCYAACSPYNCAIISNKENKINSLDTLFERMGKWKVRKENFGYIVYDRENNRLYETDDEGFDALKKLLSLKSFNVFKDEVNNNQMYKKFLSCVEAVYI